MGFSMLSLEALRALDAIDRRGSFAAAAQTLHKVPSALSYTIRQLEQSLGTDLFDRSGQRARLTPTGRMVLEQGRELLAAAERLHRRARQSALGWEPRVRLVVEALLPLAPLWPLLERFADEHPLVEVELREEALNGSWEALAEQRADLLIGVGQQAPAGVAVAFAPMGELTLQLVCAAHHPLAQIPAGQLTEHHLAQHTQVVLRDSARAIPTLSVGLLGAQKQLLVNHYAAKREAIFAGLGFGHLAGSSVTRAISDGRLVSLAGVKPNYQASINLAWDKSRAGKATLWWRDQILAANSFIGEK